MSWCLPAAPFVDHSPPLQAIQETFWKGDSRCHLAGSVALVCTQTAAGGGPSLPERSRAAEGLFK